MPWRQAPFEAGLRRARGSLLPWLPPSSFLMSQSSSHRLLLDPHPDCKLSGSPCSLYSRLPAPAADRAATLLHLQCQEEERSLRASEPLPLGGSYLTQVRHVPLSLERLSRQLEKNKLKTLLRGRCLLSLQDRKSVIPSGTDAGNRLFSLLDVGECHSRAQILFVFWKLLRTLESFSFSWLFPNYCNVLC